MRLVVVLIAMAVFFHAESRAQSAVGSWKILGPKTMPSWPAFGNTANGMGCVDQVKFHPSDPQKMYVVCRHGGMFTSGDNGEHWNATGTDQMPMIFFESLCVDHTNDSILFVGGFPYGIFKSTDGGNTWNPFGTGITGWPEVSEILMDPGNHNILVAATSEGVYRTTDGGASWTQQQVGYFEDMKQKPGSSTTLYASSQGALFRSTDFGQTWTMTFNGFSPSFVDGTRIAVSAANPDLVYLSETPMGYVYKSTNSGQTFTTVYNSFSPALTYAYPFGGFSQGDYNFDITASPVNPDELYLVSHLVWRSLDGGVTWTNLCEYNTKLHTDMHSIDFNPYNPAQLWCGSDGGLWLSADTSRLHWEEKNKGLTSLEVAHAAQSPTIRQWMGMGTQDNGFITLDTLNGWKTTVVNDFYSRLYFDYSPNSVLYYLTNSSRGSIGAGSTATTNLNPPGGNWNRPYSLMSSYFNSSGMALMSLSPVSANVAFTVNDSVWRSMDISSLSPTWTMIKPFASYTQMTHDIAASAADSNILYFVTDSNKLYRSTNVLSANPVFTTITTPDTTAVKACIATNKHDADIVYLSCGSKLFRSADQGGSWTNITANLPDLNIEKIIHDDHSANERLFVASGNYIFYKDNSSPTWNSISGLPVCAYLSDLMIYNDSTAGSVLRAALYGRGIWEAGINNHMKPEVHFEASRRAVCVGDTILFTQDVWGTIQNASWTFPGGSPATATGDSVVVVYNTPGSYSVSLAGSGPGGADTVLVSDYVFVRPLPQANALAQNFEGAVYPPPGWQLSDTNGTAWAQVTGVSGFGAGSKAIRADNFSYFSFFRRDKIISPPVDLTAVNNARLTFDVAYARRSSFGMDSLSVKISPDCGATFFWAYGKAETDLATAPDNALLFVPSATEWRKDTVSLQSFAGQQILVSFENMGRACQPIYIDNINVETSPVPGFGVSDTAICVGDTLQFSDSSLYATGWSWTFQGGTPAVSATQHPSVVYNTAGTYQVRLISTNAVGSDTIIKTSYVHVYAAPVITVTAAGNVLTATSPGGTSYQWYLNGNAITGATTGSYTTTQSGSYTVRVTNASGCSKLSAAFVVTAVPLLTGDQALKFFPNPASGTLQVRGERLAGTVLNLRIYDMSGRVVYLSNLSVNGGAVSGEINVSGLARGIYEIEVKSEEGNTYREKLTLK